jgi:hypothetical protein
MRALTQLTSAAGQLVTLLAATATTTFSLLVRQPNLALDDMFMSTAMHNRCLQLVPRRVHWSELVLSACCSCDLRTTNFPA